MCRSDRRSYLALTENKMPRFIINPYKVATLIFFLNYAFNYLVARHFRTITLKMFSILKGPSDCKK